MTTPARDLGRPAEGEQLPPSALLRLEDLGVTFSPEGALARLAGKRRGVRAVDGVSLSVSDAEVLGVVGESGSGKTTLALAALRLQPATSGRVFFAGADIGGLRRQAARRFRRDAVMIFQDPHSSLSPRMRVSSLLKEPYVIHRIGRDEQYSVAELLRMVELPERLADSYPHELSGGQARRVGIARALALRPRLIVADEPTAGLDVSAASAILNLVQELRAEHGTAYLVITHALNVVGYLADRIAVMYLGRVVETGAAEQVYDTPLHPYTRALIASVPDKDSGRAMRHQAVVGEIPSPRNPPSGCHFHPRCPFAIERCSSDDPVLEEAAPGRWVACLRWRDVANAGSPREHEG
jgi:oligopeptide/dipeptide ABC transporter ATP-binding protein